VAKGRQIKLLASDAAVHRSGDEAGHWRDVGSIALRGRSTPTPIREPLLDPVGATEAAREA
jgi:class 3 adenylate cyclase